MRVKSRWLRVPGLLLMVTAVTAALATATERPARASDDAGAADGAVETATIRIVAPPGTVITLDGSAAGTAPLPEPIVVAPGPHRLDASREGRTMTSTLEPRGGETLVWQPEWPEAAPPPPPPEAPPAAVPTAAPVYAVAPDGVDVMTANGKPTAGSKWLVAAGLVVGGLVSFGISGAFAAAASNQAAREDNLKVTTGACPQPPMSASCIDLRNAADTHATYNNVALGFAGAGGAFVVAGLVALVAWPHTPASNAAAHVAPVVGPQGGGLRWEQRF